MIKKIINICGKAGSGKDTFANYLQEEFEKRNLTILRLNYADYLKYLCQKLFNWNGQKDEEGRTLLQKVGTDIVREQDADFWVRSVYEVATLFDSFYDYVICADCRFPNENEFWQKAGYKTETIWIERLKQQNILNEEQLAHSSENSMLGYHFNSVVFNDTLEGLRQTAEQYVNELLKDTKDIGNTEETNQ